MSKTISTILNLKDNFSDTIKKTITNTNTFINGMKQSETQATKMKTGISGAFNGIGESIKNGVGLGAGLDIWEQTKESFSEMITFGSDLQKSLNSIQTSTGYSGDAMSGMKQVMTDIYNDNFGENFVEIGEAITTIGQQTGASGDGLKGLTENALLMKDTFSMDVSESIRSVSTMMKQFGITGDEAFNLIAQGKQKGLDFSGELLDSVNEYSVQFSKVGLNAEDMFNIFETGTKSGAFNVDKIGDSVKEFSIRSIDGSKTTVAGFAGLGLSADDMAKKFGKGGDIAKQAFQETITALKNMNDPIQQSIVGVDLFGTQFEDLGISAISQLNNLDGGISNTTDALGEINKVQYDDLGSAFAGIKRNIETGVILPISDAVLPKLSEFSNWFVSSMPTIKDTVSELIQPFFNVGDAINNVLTHATDTFNFISTNWKEIKPIVEAITLAVVAWKVAEEAIVLWTGAVTLATGLWSTIELMIWGISNATTVWEGVQWALNVAMDANPIGLIVGAIGLLGLAIFEVVAHWQDLCTWVSTTWDKLKDNPVAEFIANMIPFVGVLFEIAKHWTDITDAIKGAWDWLKSWIGLDVPDKNVNVTQHQMIDTNSDPLNPKLPNIDVGNNATGTQYWKGGLTKVGEHGTEIVDLPSGGKVKTASETKKLLGGGKGGDVYVTIQGNVIGNEEYADSLGEHIVGKIQSALINV